jgi:hypothetical protein
MSWPQTHHYLLEIRRLLQIFKGIILTSSFVLNYDHGLNRINIARTCRDKGTPGGRLESFFQSVNHLQTHNHSKGNLVVIFYVTCISFKCLYKSLIGTN